MNETRCSFHACRQRRRGPARVLASLAMLLLFAPSLALPATGVPDPGQCVVPDLIVGCTTAAPCGVMIRDSNGNPMPDALVELRFGPAIPYGQDLCLWDAQVPPATQSCATYTISALTDQFGIAAFVPLFGGHVSEPLVEVAVEGIPLGAAKARSTDINGDGKCCLIDLAWLRYYYWDEPEAEQADFNNSGSVELGDLNLFREGYFGPNTSAPVCP